VKRKIERVLIAICCLKRSFRYDGTEFCFSVAGGKKRVGLKPVERLILDIRTKSFLRQAVHY